MKVKDLINNIEKYKKQFPDFEDWDIYTEQPQLTVPTDFEDYDSWLKKNKDNPDPKIVKSHEYIEELKKQGWKFIYDSEGWVYRETNDMNCNHTLFADKIITINNNY